MPRAGGFFLLTRAHTDDISGFPVIGPADAPLMPVASVSAEARYRALVRHLPDTVVALYDRDLLGVSIDGPPLIEAHFPAHEFEGKPLAEVMPEVDHEHLLPKYRAALDGEASSCERAPLENGK